MNDVKKQLEKSVVNYFSTIKTAKDESEKLKAEKEAKLQAEMDQSSLMIEQSQSE